MIHPKIIGRGETLRDNIRDFNYKIISKVIRFLEVIKEIYLFIPTIIQVYTWDYSSLFIVLRHWLNRMKEAHEKDAFHVDAKKRVKELNLCILLLDRIINDYYLENAFIEHDIRWGAATYEHIPSKTHPGYYELKSTRKNVVTEKDILLERKEYRKCVDHSTYLQDQDINMLFNNIKRYYRYWWI